MITEKGSIKVTTEHNENMYKELNRTNIILAILYTVFGGIMLIAGLLLYILTPENDLLLLWVALGTILLILGITIIISAKNINKLNGVNSKAEENEFFQGYFISREYVNGEHLATAKIYYNRIVKVRETKNYIFIYNTRVTAVSVDKRNLTEQEINSIRSLLARPIPGAAAYMNLNKPAEQATQPDQSVQPDQATQLEQSATQEQEQVAAEASEENAQTSADEEKQ
ncbi:MAG: YcxB family protein [Candidatus Coproplasma sp.]